MIEIHKSEGQVHDELLDTYNTLFQRFKEYSRLSKPTQGFYSYEGGQLQTTWKIDEKPGSILCDMRETPAEQLLEVHHNFTLLSCAANVMFMLNRKEPLLVVAALPVLLFNLHSLMAWIQDEKTVVPGPVFNRVKQLQVIVSECGIDLTGCIKRLAELKA